MRIKISFFVQNSIRKSAVGSEAYVPDSRIYSSIWRMATAHFGLRIPNQIDTLVIDASENDPHIPECLTLLKEAGWEPFYGEFLPPELKNSRFEVRRFREYEVSDRDGVVYLTIHRWGHWERIFDFFGIENGIFKAKVAGSKISKKHGITNNPRSPRFVNDELKRELEAEVLVGLSFIPVLWDYPEKAKTKFWQLSSNITMPRCLLPVLDMPEDPPPWRTYDDGGHFPQELVFRRSEVRTIEPFDVALTSPEEDIHRGPNSWTHTIVVSQRCRQVFKKLKLTNVELVPARLVSDDWQRPPSDHDRLRADGV